MKEGNVNCKEMSMTEVADAVRDVDRGGVGGCRNKKVRLHCGCVWLKKHTE